MKHYRILKRTVLSVGTIAFFAIMLFVASRFLLNTTTDSTLQNSAATTEEVAERVPLNTTTDSTSQDNIATTKDVESCLYEESAIRIGDRICGMTVESMSSNGEIVFS